MKKTTKLRNAAWMATSGLALLVALPAAAQTTGGGLEEITVTAEKRTENLQRTPIAVTKLSAQTLENVGAQNILDLNTQIPNVFIGGAGGAGKQAASFYIRGIGVDRNSLEIEPGVGLYIDDMYYGKTAGSFLNVLGVDSIEVLRGPQGTLFGKNTIGGAIRYTTKKPGKEFGGTAEVNLGTRERWDVKGSLNVPVNEIVSLRFSAGTFNQDGYVKSIPTGDNLGSNHDTVARAQLRIKTDRLTVDASADYTYSDSNGNPQVLLALNPTLLRTTQWNAANPTNPYDARYITGDAYKTYATNNGYKLRGYGVGLTAAYELADNFTVKSLTSWRRNWVMYKTESDVSPLMLSQISTNQDMPAFSQELQVVGDAFDKRLTYIGGLYYFHETPRQLDNRQYFWEPTLFCYCGSALSDNVETTSKAVFTQIGYAITDPLKATLGLRYSEDDKSAHVLRYKPGPLVTSPTLEASNSKTFRNFSPKFALQYQWTEDLMTYASVSRGYKAGGFNNGLTTTAPNLGVLPFENEKVWTYEAGIRSELFDRRLRVNLSGFYSDYSNLQITASQGGVYILVANVASARIPGWEGELEWLVAPGFTLSGSIGELFAEYTQIGSATQQVTAIALDSPLAGSPRLTWSLNANYDLDLKDGSRLQFNANYGHKSAVNSFSGVATALTIPSYGLLNLSAYYTPPASRFSFGIVGKNVLDKKYFLTGSRFDSVAGGNTGPVVATTGAPGEVYVTAKVRF